MEIGVVSVTGTTRIVGWTEVVVVIRVHVPAELELFHVVQALCAVRFAPGSG
jgi:hypothetical protein